MSCAVYIVYTFHLSLHHVNFGRFKTKSLSLNILYPLDIKLNNLLKMLFECGQIWDKHVTFYKQTNKF